MSNLPPDFLKFNKNNPDWDGEIHRIPGNLNRKGKQPSKEDWDLFQTNRTIPEEQKYVSCFAAFNHLRITRQGLMMPCCFSTWENQRWNKEKGLHHYWFEGLNVEYQEEFLNSRLHDGCETCKRRIEHKISPPIVDYDWNVGKDRMKDVTNISYPKIIEFEISNLCNMECPMCIGYLSSKHAMNRDKHIDWGTNVFDNEDNLNHLIEELKEFIPHLDKIRFVGGEPLAHKGMFKIAKVIRDIKPELEIQCTTNGSIFNKQVKKLCEENNMKFSISLDTVIPEEYQKIRIGGVFEETYSNIKKIKDIVGPENITISSVLMSVNCKNIIKIFEYAIENKFAYFVNAYSRHNMVTGPDWGLHLVDHKIIKKVIEEAKGLLYKLKINPELYKSLDLAWWTGRHEEAVKIVDELAKLRIRNDGYEMQLNSLLLLLNETLVSRSIGGDYVPPKDRKAKYEKKLKKAEMRKKLYESSSEKDKSFISKGICFI